MQKGYSSMSSKQPMSVGDFLSTQAEASEALLATVERAGVDQLKVTPWQPGRGCLCAYAFRLPESAIRALTPTGDVHACCGKRLSVVEVAFAESHKAVGDVVSQQVRLGLEHPKDALGNARRPVPGMRSSVTRLGYSARYGAIPLQISDHCWKACMHVMDGDPNGEVFCDHFCNGW